ncbi:MAG: type II toxin-antitoxin system RatA family toxin [Acetobacter sp.]|nr:type II toxin-antitoxin system RatA family toxin [Acetobacter sp.]MBQ5469910.1 type II toxin-antitoxin system RatA family toxin [Acetobacter sp.]
MPKYTEQRILPYQPDQVFKVVADVGSYPDFLPWCVGARVYTHTQTNLVAELTVGFGIFRESFTSYVALDEPSTITVRYERGPFRYLYNQWVFLPHDRGCCVKFFVDFELRSLLLQAAIGAVFTEATRRMVFAFTERLKKVYATTPSISYKEECDQRCQEMISAKAEVFS